MFITSFDQVADLVYRQCETLDGREARLTGEAEMDQGDLWIEVRYAQGNTEVLPAAEVWVL